MYYQMKVRGKPRWVCSLKQNYVTRVLIISLMLANVDVIKELIYKNNVLRSLN